MKPGRIARTPAARHADSIAARTWQAVLSCVMAVDPRLTIPDALACGLCTPQELHAAHAYAVRVWGSA